MLFNNIEMIEFKKLCDYCGEPLRARPAQNAYKDFEERNLHIKCFKEIGPLSAARLDRKSTRLNSSHVRTSRMPSSA